MGFSVLGDTPRNADQYIRGAREAFKMTKFQVARVAVFGPLWTEG